MTKANATVVATVAKEVASSRITAACKLRPAYIMTQCAFTHTG